MQCERFTLPTGTAPKVGDVYEAPWGRFVLHRISPRVLRSLDDVNSFAIEPGPDYVATGEFDPTAIAFLPLHERREDGPPAPVEALAVGVLPGPDHGPWRPGLNVARMPGSIEWTPCLTRARGDNDEPMAREHAWFLDRPGTLYCWECRRGRARVVYGPAARIAEIRAALERGELAQAHELVRRLADPTQTRSRAPGAAPGYTTPCPRGEARAVPGAPFSSCSSERVDEGPSAKDEAGSFLVRTRSDALDVDAVDFVLERRFFGQNPADWDEYFTERAAVFEYLGELPRQVAEAKARQLAGPRPTSRSSARASSPSSSAPRPQPRPSGPQTGRSAGDAPPNLGPGRCRSCRASVVWATTTDGRRAPFQADQDGLWEIDRGIARQAGAASRQLELGAAPRPRWTSHFARCPDAAKWRSR